MRLLPGDIDPLSARKRAKRVRPFEVAQQGSSTGASPLARAALACPGDDPGRLEFRRVDNVFPQAFQVDDRQVGLGPIRTGEDPSVGRHPNR